MAGGFGLLPGPFLDRRNRRPEEQRDQDAIGEWFHQPLHTYLWSSPGWRLDQLRPTMTGGVPEPSPGTTWV